MWSLQRVSRVLRAARFACCLLLLLAVFTLHSCGLSHQLRHRHQHLLTIVATNDIGDASRLERARVATKRQNKKAAAAEAVSEVLAREGQKARQSSLYSSINGTLDFGLCDKHLLCKDVWAAYVDQQFFCPPGSVFCQKSLQFRCSSRLEVFTRRNCRLEDCLEVRSMLVDADSCAQWFPEIVETSANRNPVESMPNPTQVMGANDESPSVGAFARPLGASCVIGADADTCSSTCCGQHGPLIEDADPPDQPRCVTPQNTRLGAFCVADCQCETGYCNVDTSDAAMPAHT